MKKFLSLVLAFVMILSVACVASADDLYEKPLVLGYLGEPADENFYAIPDGLCNVMWKICGGALMICDDVNGQYAPALFESWETSEDQLTWTCHIRKDAYWHDGVQVTADDVIFSEQYFKPVEEFANFHIWWQFDMEYELVKIDDFTVAFKLKAPSAAMLGNLSDQWAEVIPEHIWKDVPRAEFTNVPAAKCPVGFGPYKMVEFNPGESIVFEANEQYFGGAPKIKTLIIQLMGTSASATLALESGDIDGLSLAGNDYARLLEEGKIAGQQIDLVAEHILSINQYEEPLKDVRMRKALNYLMDNQMVIDSAYGGIAKVAFGTFLPQTIYSDPSVWTDYSYDVEKAKALIEDMGYTMGSDGYYQKDGKTLEFEVIYDGSNDTFTSICVLYQYTAQQGGVKINLTALDSAILSERRNNMDFDMYFSGWSLGIDNCTYNANNYYYVKEPTENSQRVADLFVIGASSNDDQVRADAYREIDRILSDDAVYVYIAQRGQCFGYDKDLEIGEAERSSGNDFNYWNKLYWKN